MDKLLYIAFKDFSNLHFGANSKVLSQCRAFESYGYDVELIGRSETDTVLITTDENVKVLKKNTQNIKNKRISNLFAKGNQMKNIEEYLQNKSYDACYIRYDFSDANFISLLKSVKKACRRVVLELPTYPYEEENNIGFMNKVKMAIDKHYRTKMKDYIDVIVTFYSGYSELFGIPVLVVPNGFDFSMMDLAQKELSDDVVHIVAVSSMREWHGYERIIEGMKNYYAEEKDDKKNFVLHLVGNGREYGKYKALVEKYSLESHVIMEGAMFGEKLNALYEDCALGIDSLARHRSGISVLSSLKSREYGAKGIPLINSCKIDIIGDDFPYMLRVTADESPVDMDAVADFYEKCYNSGKSRQEIGMEIRSYIEEKSGMKSVLSKVVEEFGK